MATVSTGRDTSPSAAVRPEPEPSAWIYFAAMMLLVAGVFDICFGLAAILNDQVVTVDGRGVIVWDFTVWGWVQLIAGVVMMAVGAGLFAMKGWARWTAVMIAGLAAVLQVGMITAFPLWSLLIIALNVIVIYALTARWQASFA